MHTHTHPVIIDSTMCTLPMFEHCWYIYWQCPSLFDTAACCHINTSASYYWIFVHGQNGWFGIYYPSLFISVTILHLNSKILGCAKDKHLWNWSIATCKLPIL